MFRIVRTLVLIVLAALALSVLTRLGEQTEVGVPELKDGDSLVLDGREIRLKGIDAPEFEQQCRRTGSSRKYPCGREAKRHLRKLIGGRKVECTGWEIDKYDRLLAVCKAGDTELNRTMVLDGWATSFGDYRMEENTATDKKRGLWSGDFTRPSDWRRQARGPDVMSWLRSLFESVF